MLRLFCFFVIRVRFAPFAEFVVRKLAFYFLDIFAAPVVEALACSTLKSDEIYLRHKFCCYVV